MKNIMFVFFAFISVISLGQNVADGKADEWKIPLRFNDQQAHLQYDVTNNDSVLFVCIRISDAKFQMKCAQAGMTFYIDTTGKKKKKIAIDFPLRQEKGMPIGMGQPGSNQDKYMFKASILSNLKTFSTEGFIIGNGTHIVKNLQGIIIASAFDSVDVLTIECQIPFKTFFHILTSADKGKVITLALNAKGLSRPEMGGGPEGGPPMDGSGSPPMGGSGGPPMGGSGGPPMGGGNRPNDFEEMEDLFQSSTTILRYTLITK